MGQTCPQPVHCSHHVKFRTLEANCITLIALAPHCGHATTRGRPGRCGWLLRELTRAWRIHDHEPVTCKPTEQVYSSSSLSGVRRRSLPTTSPRPVRHPNGGRQPFRLPRFASDDLSGLPVWSPMMLAVPSKAVDIYACRGCGAIIGVRVTNK